MITPPNHDSIISLRRTKRSCKRVLDFGSSSTLEEEKDVTAFTNDGIPIHLNFRKENVDNEEHNTKPQRDSFSIDSTEYTPKVLPNYYHDKDDSPTSKQQKSSCKKFFHLLWSSLDVDKEEETISAYTEDGSPLDLSFGISNQMDDGLKCIKGEVKKFLMKERKEFENRAKYFIEQIRPVQGVRPFQGWKGSVVDSVVGVFLTQNVTDKISSSCYMSLSSIYPNKNITNDPENNHHTEPLDWNAIRLADVGVIANILKTRGQQNNLADRIQRFLNKVHKQSSSFDIEWLRNTNPGAAKLYFEGVNGLGVKCIECLRLLTLRQKAFPVDTHVSRIVVRLGWVPIEELPDNILFHELEKYPGITAVHEYLKHRISNLDADFLYELHYQLITFGKVFCTKQSPNCKACPLKICCKHYESAFPSPLDIEDMGDLHPAKKLAKKLPATKAKVNQELRKASGRRTIHQVYELPDEHELLKLLDKRDPDDKHPYLLLVWPGDPCNADTEQEKVQATILVPCRTAARGSFPLDGTFFQPNEVFADDKTSEIPLDVPTRLLKGLTIKKNLVCGSTIETIFKDFCYERTEQCFSKEYVCISCFNMDKRVQVPLHERLHSTKSPRKGTNK